MSGLRVIGVVQARMSSHRLPGKVLAEVGGRPMLDYQMQRLARCRELDQLVVAIPDTPSDQPLAELGQRLGWQVWSGPHEDVLARLVQVADRSAADLVVRLTADCPLIDPHIVDRVAALARTGRYDYVSNVHPRRTFPRGLDAEAIAADALRRLSQAVVDPRLREHVTLAIREEPAPWRVGSIVSSQDWSRLRWTVDQGEDLELVREIADAFGGRHFSWTDVLRAYASHPHWWRINSSVRQKAG